MTANKWLALLHEPCPVATGSVVEVTGVLSDPDPLPVGTRGTVTGGNGSQLWVKWDNGRSLMLLVGGDPYRVVDAPEEAES